MVGGFISVRNRGGKLVLLDVTAPIRELLSITYLLDVIETFDSEEEAVRAAAA